MENGRYSYLEDALANRRGIDRLEAERREEEHIDHIDFFTANFSAATATNSTATTASTTTALSQENSRLRASSEEPRRKEERGWGSHGVDAWWVGDWGKHKRRSRSIE